MMYKKPYCSGRIRPVYILYSNGEDAYEGISSEINLRVSIKTSEDIDAMWYSFSITYKKKKRLQIQFCERFFSVRYLLI